MAIGSDPAAKREAQQGESSCRPHNTVVCDACPDVSCPAPAGMPGAFTPPEVFQLFARCTWSPDGREAPEGFTEIKDDRIWLGDIGRTGWGRLPAFTAPRRTVRRKQGRGISRQGRAQRLPSTPATSAVRFFELGMNNSAINELQDPAHGSSQWQRRPFPYQKQNK